MKKLSLKYFVLAAALLLLFAATPNLFANPNSNVTVQFTGMGPHLNQNLYLRVIDKGTLKETSRTSLQITSAAFDVVLDAVSAGRSYYIDFFADVNSNGLYNAPPTDHAWRLELNNAVGGDLLNFAHNVSFTNIDWVYELTVNFTGMAPHIGQLLELRVENNITDEEVGRIKVAAIPSSNFVVKVPGIRLNTEYKIEFYADLNGNGLYNEPPVDHAWRVDFTNSTGNISVNFGHNTKFTDINWKYLLTVNLSSMNPHIGQKFELRLVRQDTQEEIGRYSLPAILVPDFSVFIPEFELDHTYNIDFYADLNGNGTYNAPPVDHAWRISFNTTAGDFTQAFTHNANFIDIQWPGATGLSDLGGLSPNDYDLKQNYPNPFNPTTLIRFSLPQNEFVSLKIFNVIGQEVSTLINDFTEAGNYEVEFSGSNLTSGVYLYQLTTGSFSQTKKMILTK